MSTDERGSIEWGIARLADHSYEGGLHGTCFECPFASEPSDSSGRVVPFQEVANDPTEAYFTCSLPSRRGAIGWGEYAPCTEKEWAEWLVGAVGQLRDNAKSVDGGDG